jgi:hypothetical protein
VRTRIDCHNGAIAKLDIVVGIPAGWPDVPGLQILLGSQVRLGQRRTAEGDTGFPPDDDHWPRETLLPERRGRIAARDASADDHNGVSVGSHSHALHSGAQAAERTIRRSQPTSAGQKVTGSQAPRYHIREGNNATSLSDAVAANSNSEEGLSAWGDSQREAADRLLQVAELFERYLVFEAPDLSAMSPAGASAWMTAVHPMMPISLPES